MKTLWKTIRQCDSLGKILPLLMVLLTRQGRYRPEVEWSSKSWTHNVFRAYELVFWRRKGIRAESSVTLTGEYKFFTIEAFMAYVETLLRTTKVWKPIRITNLQLALPGPNIPWISFAIAHDADALSADTTSSPTSWNHTCTGSNGFLAVYSVTQGTSSTPPSASGTTYNSVAMTSVASRQNVTSGHNSESQMWFLHAPSTGINSVSVTWSGGTSGHVGGISTSYSGAQTVDSADAAANGVNSGNATWSLGVTTIADKCWVILGATTHATLGTLTAGQTQRNSLSLAGTSSGVLLFEDTNAVVTPAGSQTMTVTAAGSSLNAGTLVCASFAPGATVATLEWIQPINQPTNHYRPDIVSL